VAEWIDHGLDSWLREIDRAGSLTVEVGYVGETAKIAAVQEYGSRSRSIPARPFFSRATRSRKLKSIAAKVLSRLRDGKITGANATEEIGEALRAAIVHEVSTASGWAQANAPTDPPKSGPPLIGKQGRLLRPRVQIVRRSRGQ
jgi:hypothetical protein